MPSIIIYFGWVHRSLFTILILFFAQISAQFRPMNVGNLPSISSEEKMLLEKFGLSELNDFVARGRGKGSVSRLPFVGGDPKTLPNLELTSNGEDEEQNEDEEELTEIGTPPPNLFQVIMPSMESKKNEKIEERKKFVENENISKKGPTKEEPGPEDYEKLAKILQKFLSQRKINEKEKKEGIHKNEGKMSTKSESTTKMPVASSSNILGKSTVIEEESKKGDEAMMISLSTGTKKKFGKENLNGEEILSTELEGVSWSGSAQKIEGIVHHSQSTIRPKILGKILIQPSRPLNSGNLPKEIVDGMEVNSYSPKESKKIGMAYVSVLREVLKLIMPRELFDIHTKGLARQSDKDQDYTFVASITLIRDQGKVILVDTGLATDINGRTDLIEKLGRLNIAPPGVNFVVTTHGHADHSGNTNDFPDAFHFQGTIVHHRTKFNFSNLFEEEKHKLTENVELIRIPGHTPEDIGVVVSNTDRYGRVIVAGDTFLAAEDMNFPMMWRPLAWNETAQEESRRRILCLADFVIPGHGKVFRVTDEMRARVDCGDQYRRIGNKKTRNE